MNPVETRRRLYKSAVSALLALMLANAWAATPAGWVLSYEGQSTSTFWNKRTASLVRDHVPAPLSVDVGGGLGGQYRAQYERLENWIPAR